MDMDQVAEIFRANMTRLVRDAATRNRLGQLAAAGDDPLRFPVDRTLDGQAQLPSTVRRVA